jgi:hypothetical protein
MQPLPKLLSLTIALLCAAVGLSAAAFGIAALFIGEKPFWMIVGFEIVTVVASVLGVMFARGRFQDGQGLALACVAGCFGAGAFLAWLSVQGRIQVKGSDATIGLNGWLMARLAAAAVLAAIGAFAVLRRNPASVGYVIRAMLTGGPVVLGAALVFMARGSLAGALQGVPAWLLSIAVGVLGIGAVALLSASGHCLIRAFEMGRQERA